MCHLYFALFLTYLWHFGPVYTVPDYFSYRINFHSEVKNKGVYTIPFVLLLGHVCCCRHGNK
jgi:hypothetical protein